MLAVTLSVVNDTIASLNGDHGIPHLVDGDWTDSALVTYKLFNSGCMINGVRNCTTVCSDTKLIWSKESGSDPISNFANCIAYPLIADVLIQGDLVSPAFAATAKDFGIEAVSKETMTTVNTSTQACFTAYCKGNIRCPEGQSGVYPFSSPFYSLPNGAPNTMVIDYDTVCDSKGVVSTDIAGVGIVVANIIQVTLLYVFWLVLRVLTIQRAKTWLWNADDSRMERWQRYLRESHYGRTTIQGLVSFQKAQCGFSLALGLAILKASSIRNALGAVSQADLKINLNALRVLAAAGTLMPVLTQYLLQELHQSWSLFFLSISTALSLFIIQKVNLKPETWTFQPETSGPWMDVCGGMSPPNLCDLSYDLNLDDSASFHDWTFAVMMVGLAIVLFCTCARIKNYFAYLWPIFDIIFIIFLAVYATHLPRLRNRNISIDETGWTFGQVIAVTLWLPLMVEWTYKMNKPTLDKLLQPLRAWCINMTEPCWGGKDSSAPGGKGDDDDDDDGDMNASEYPMSTRVGHTTDIEAQQPPSRPETRANTTTNAPVLSPPPTPMSAIQQDTHLLQERTPTPPKRVRKPRNRERRS